MSPSIDRLVTAILPAGGCRASAWASQSVEAWTSGSAYAEHAERVKGRLREGMLADITVLDRDLAQTPPNDVAQAKVEATVVGGRLVYES